MSLRPAPLRYDAFASRAGSLDFVIGRSLTKVIYGMPTDTTWQRDPIAVSIHGVDLAVVLAFGEASLRLDWAQVGFDEGLAVGLDPELPASWARCEVQSEPEWVALIGVALTSITLAWHQASADAATTALAAVFAFENGQTVTVSLGEAVGGVPSYLPDELVVLFDDTVAQAYVDPIATGLSRVPGSR